VQWFHLWEGTRQQYKQYYNKTLRMLSDWVWIKQPSQRVVVVTPDPDAGGSIMKKEQLISLIKSSVHCDERGSRFGRQKNTQRNIIRDICDISLKQLPSTDLLSEEDIRTLTGLSDVSFSWDDMHKIAKYGEFRGVTWEAAKSALKAALDLKKKLSRASTCDVDESWNTSDEPDDIDTEYKKAVQDIWETTPYVPKIRVPYSLAGWLAKQLPPHPDSNEASRKVWLDVKEVTEDYEKAAFGLVQTQGKMRTSVLVTVQNHKEIIAEYLERDKEVSNEEVGLKQKLCAVLEAGNESSLPEAIESDLSL